MNDPLDLTEKTLSREEKYTGKFLSVHVDQVELPNGHTSFREVVEHVDGVAIVPLDDRNNVLAVTQYRYVFGKTLLEIPAGKLDGGEDPVTGALRELKEETGAVPDTLEKFFQPPVVTAKRCIFFWPEACISASSSQMRMNFCAWSVFPLTRWFIAL